MMERSGALRDRDGIVRSGELRVLALDGGGVRGALIAGYLRRVEEVLHEQGKPGILDSADLIIGTSTGAIVGALLAIGFSAKSIAQFYETKGRFVFQPPIKQWSKWVGFLVVCGIVAVIGTYLSGLLGWSWDRISELFPHRLLLFLGLFRAKIPPEMLDLDRLVGFKAVGLFLGGVVIAVIIQLLVWIRAKGFPLYQVFFPKYGLRDLEVELAVAIDAEAQLGGLRLSPAAAGQPVADLPVDAASCRLAIITYDLARDEAVVVKSHYGGTTQRSGWKLIDAVRSSSAAPFYFPPKRIPAAEAGHNGPGEVEGIECDGGVWANNPALVGYVEGQKLRAHLAKHGIEDVRVKVLSVGTGVPQPHRFKPPLIGYGLLWWAGPFLGTLWNGQSMNVHYMLSKLMDKEDYLRVNFDIPKELSALDVVKNFPALLEAGVACAVIERDPVPHSSELVSGETIAAGVEWFS